MSSELVLDAHEIYKIYKSGDGLSAIETVALKGVNISVNQGDFIAILGPSGSGKTSLINCLSGLDLPSAGDVNYYENGHKIRLTQLSEKNRDKYRLGRIAVVFQSENLIRSLTAKENAELPLNFLGIKDKNIVSLIFESIGIDHRLQHKPDQLSGGEKQRVSLACSLVYNPLVIFADEPTGELDVDTTEEVMEAFEKISKLGTTIIMVTHNPKVAQKANIRYEMHDGYLRLTGQMVSGDEITIREDVYGRLRIPVSWLKQLSITDDLVGLVVEENEILLINPNKANKKSSHYSHVDSQGRVMLPEKIRKGNLFKWTVERMSRSIRLIPNATEE
ncbi:MAG: ABC transporter ATP-binding protein [Candidatus Hodarchaeales archaeon]|jgi:putative ABC transport system ATP-binding protein